MRKSRTVHIGLIVVVIAAMVITGAYLATASHNFSDVPTGAFYHNAVEWMVNRAVTAGCAAGLYCPDAATTRGQIAVFLNKLGSVSTVSYIYVNANPGAIDIDTSPVVCPTTTDYTPSYPQRARVDAAVSLQMAGLGAAQIVVLVSTNGGATWGFFTGVNPRASADAGGEWGHANDFGFLNLNAGTPYRFAAGVARDTTAGSGTADATASRCKILVTITNRNPDGMFPDTLAPLAPSGAGDNQSPWR